MAGIIFKLKLKKIKVSPGGGPVFLPNQRKSKVSTKVGTAFQLNKRKIKNSIEAKLVLLAKPKGNQGFDEGCL